MNRPRVLRAHTFSGDHTLCHAAQTSSSLVAGSLAPATGKAMSELIQVGRSETLDIRPYRLERFASGDLIPDPQI